MALFSLSKILTPCAVAKEEPKKRLPTEQIDNSSKDRFGDGQNVGAWTTGNVGLNFVKYI
jgi:hypothetical protein